MTNQLPRVHEMEHHAADWATTRPVVSGTQGVVATGHPLVSIAGMRMLLSGGNAVRRGGGRRLRRGRRGADRVLYAVRRVRGARPRRPDARDGRGERPGRRAGARDDGLLPRAGPRSHSDRPGPGRPPVVHRAGRRRRLPDAARDDRYPDARRGARACRPLRAPGFPMYEYMHRMLAIPESRTQFDLYPPGGDRRLLSRRPRARGRRTVPAAGARRDAGAARRGRRVGPRPSRRGHRRRARALLSRRHRRRRSAASPSAWAACSAPATWPPTARDWKRRSRSPSPDARSSARPVDPGARAHAGPRHAGGVRPARDGPQLLALHSRRDRGAEARVRRPRAPLRRRPRPPRGPAGAGVRARAGGPDPHGPRDAGSARARRSAPHRLGCGGCTHARGRGLAVGERPGAGRRRHDAHRGHRSRRHHDLPDAERRRVPQVRVRAGAGLHAQHAQRDVRAGGRSSQRPRAGQAPPHDTDQLPDLPSTACR